LRDILRNVPEHALFVYVDLREVAAASLWEKASSVLRPAFPSTVTTGAGFEAGVRAWLDTDQRRRILLMLDEADNFIREQSSHAEPYQHLVKLLNLMANTNHRFKFVLAGLHNVSRIVRTENSPLAQISNDAVRIGPLLGQDVGDAEFLVRGPLAAMGYEFEHREDVWRILSFTNYYPVLIQVFCQGLLRLIHEGMIRGTSPVWRINSAMVEEALRNPTIRSGLYESFDKTITHIEQRYELLTYILAEHALLEAGEGLDSEGLLASEVADRAGRYWPEAFPTGSDPSEIEYLLDEMEGFGLLRWTSAGRWTLRSRTLLDLMISNEIELLEKLESFKGRPLEVQFDPRNIRRQLPRGERSRAENMTSPLTEGQEAEIMHPLREGGSVIVIFGAPIAGINNVHAAIETSRSVIERVVEVELRGWRTKEDLLSTLRKIRGSTVRIVIVDCTTQWTPDWVSEAQSLPSVAHGHARPVFIGDPSHAFAWACSPMCSANLPRLKVMTLRPWTRSYLAVRLDALNALRPNMIDRIAKATGGWNEPCHALFKAATMTPAKIVKLIEDSASEVIADAGLFVRLGVRSDLIPVLRNLAPWADDDALSTEYFEAICRNEQDLADPAVIGNYANYVGLLSLSRDEAGKLLDLRVEMNPLAIAALKARAPAE
jgi:hypothetical protein